MLAMIEEDNYTVWTNMATCLEKFYNLLSNTEFDHLYDIYGLKLIKPISKKLGFDPKPGECKILLLLILFYVCKIDYNNTIPLQPTSSRY